MSTQIVSDIRLQPPYDSAIVDRDARGPQQGVISRPWQQFFQRLKNSIDRMQGSISGQGEEIQNLAGEIEDLESALSALGTIPKSWVSGSSGLYDTTSTSFVVPTNLSLTADITKPNVIVHVLPNDSAGSQIGAVGTSGQVEFKIGSTVFARLTSFELAVATRSFAAVCLGITPGSHTFDVQVRCTGTGTFYVHNYRLVVQELG